jgi:hypothetical protein
MVARFKVAELLLRTTHDYTLGHVRFVGVGADKARIPAGAGTQRYDNGGRRRPEADGRQKVGGNANER